MVLVENYNTPLNNGEIYNSDVYDAYQYASFIVSLKTDQNGELKHYFSPDGSNWDHEFTETYTAADGPYYKSDEIRARYYKFSFENNSGSNQTYFRSQIQFNSITTVVKVDETLADLDIRNLDSNVDSVKIYQGNNILYTRVADSAGQLIYGEANALNVNVKNSDVDIRNLNSAEDSVTISQGTNVLYTRISDGSGNLLQSSTGALNVNVQNASIPISGSVTVSNQVNTRALDSVTDNITVLANNLDIRPLSTSEDSVNCNLKDGSGNSITSTSSALNVAVQNEVIVSATDLDIRQLSHSGGSADSINSYQGGSWNVGQQGNWNVTVDNASLAVTSTDLDIRDLSSVSDSISAVQSGTWNVTVDNASLAVTSTDLDIRDLSSVSDSVSAVQSGTWNVRLQDGIGNAVNSIDSALAVFNVASVQDGFYRNLDVNLTASQVNAGTTFLYSIVATNQHATNARYLKLYDESTTPDENNTPIYTLALFPQTTQVINYVTPQEISNGLYVRCSGAIADNDTTSISTNDCVVNIQYIDRS